MVIKIMRFGKIRYPETYQATVGMAAPELLHKNSLELVAMLKRHNVLKEGISILEIGAGPCRNLKYILDEVHVATLYANDLFEDASYENMDPAVKEQLTFFEGDTLTVLENQQITVELTISSDHLMHLEYDKAPKVLSLIRDKIIPNWILLRERKKKHEDTSDNGPRLYHDYSILETNYQLLEEATSEQDGRYFLRLYKRINIDD